MLKKISFEDKRFRLLGARGVLFLVWLIMIILPFLFPKTGRIISDLTDQVVYFERGLWLFGVKTPISEYSGTIISELADGVVYFERGQWFIESKTPISEYPQIPTILFGLNHIFSFWIVNLNIQKFVYITIFSLEMIIALFMSFRIILEILPSSRGKIPFLILLPPTIYFTVGRFDILPALFCLIAINEARKRNWLFVSFILAIGTFTKWYPILIFPGFVFFASKQENKFQWKMIITFFLASGLILALFYKLGGLSSLIAPYKFHLSRSMEFISFPVLIKNLFAGMLIIDLKIYFLVFFILQISGAFLALFINFNSLNNLLHYCVVVVGVFILFSRIWSPQWLLWILMFLILLAKDSLDIILIISYNLVSYINFPILFDISGDLSAPLIVSGSIAYLILSIVIFRSLRRLEYIRFQFPMN